MVYDIDNKDSFASLIHWEEEMKKHGVDMARVKTVVLNNGDLKALPWERLLLPLG